MAGPRPGAAGLYGKASTDSNGLPVRAPASLAETAIVLAESFGGQVSLPVHQSCKD